MTLPSLLRKVGIDVHRGVTVDGTLVVGRQVLAAAAAGQVTSIQPHRFHGGEDPSPSRDERGDAWWVSDPKRKTTDIADMRERFSDVVVLDENDDLAYGVQFNTGRGRYHALILPHVDGTLPSVVVTRPGRLGRNEGRQFTKPPHLYLNGALCVASQSDWADKGYLTSVAAAWAGHWLACYTEWRMSGVWPTDGYGRNVA